MPAQPDRDVIRRTPGLLILESSSWGPMHALAVLQWIGPR